MTTVFAWIAYGYGIIQVAGWAITVIEIIAGRFRTPDPRFEGARLWYRS